MINYGLPAGYNSRLLPEYFEDVLNDSYFWQADVYRLANLLARRKCITRIIDIGCGRGQKLVSLKDTFDVVGIDYRSNIEYCQSNYNWGTWIECDLNTNIPNLDFKNSICINADVIEHIPDLTALIETLRNASKTAAYVLISTPDRERLNQGTPNGMPANKSHVREWTRQEFTDWLKSEGLPVIWSGWTVSFDKQRDKRNTILVILSSSETIDDMPVAFEEAK